MIIILSFLICTLSVALVSWFKTRSTNLNTVSGLFFGGKSNGYLVVAGSLILTNLSANQFVGENESVFINNMSVMAWGVTSVIAILLVSEFLLPVYFKYGMVTTPDFLALRYDKSTKKLVSIVFLLSYAVNLLPPVLYGGAVALTAMFSIDVFLNISYWQCIWIMVWILGITGSIYTIIGGLRAITISDSMLGAGFLFIGVCLPYFALNHLGNGHFFTGLNLLLTKHTSHLNAIGSDHDAIPFGTIFTGMILVNIYYWGMEQYIVQQSLAAKSLKDAQKGMAYAALAKLISPLLINLPGLVAVHLYANVENTAAIFPMVVADVLPKFLLGFTAALIFGAAMTTYNAGLHGSSTLFVLNIYKPYCDKKNIELGEKKMIRVSKRFEIILSLTAMFAAPFILFASNGFYAYLQQVAGLFSMPILTIVVVGFINKKVPPSAAKAGLIMFMVSYFCCEYIFDVQLHFLHVLAILFLIVSAFMMIYGFFFPMKQKVVFNPPVALGVNIVPWNKRHIVAFFLIVFTISLYLFFSPLGVAK